MTDYFLELAGASALELGTARHPLASRGRIFFLIASAPGTLGYVSTCHYACGAAGWSRCTVGRAVHTFLPEHCTGGTRAQPLSRDLLLVSGGAAIQYR
jgi:hypothetical protein